uniref:Uncharacterized protein n=1 Tax=Lepeophtheirus salmonis TaxID=72036 RepID=A0A0K2V4X3_LEPSM
MAWTTLGPRCILAYWKGSLMLREVAADKFNMLRIPAVHLHNLWARVYYCMLDGFLGA